MKTVQISLNSIDKVKSFVNDITKFDYDFDLVSGRYVIDAKSIMGIFSLDLSKPIDLNIHTEDGAEEVLKVLKFFSVKHTLCRLSDLSPIPAFFVGERGMDCAKTQHRQRRQRYID